MGARSIAAMGHVRMMAAAQPFLSGAISKTVNLPEDATVEEIEDVYLAVVAVDRERLQAELPALQVDVLDLLDRGVLGQVDRLGDRTGQERLGRRHHPHVAHGAIERSPIAVSKTS